MHASSGWIETARDAGASRTHAQVSLRRRVVCTRIRKPLHLLVLHVRRAMWPALQCKEHVPIAFAKFLVEDRGSSLHCHSRGGVGEEELPR